MSDCPFRPDDLLPHAPPMVLLDHVQNWSTDTISASLTITATTPFLHQNQGVPAHVGLEWMAQACGLFAGLEAKTQNKPVQIGYLLGTRRYHADRPYFRLGEALTVEGHLVLRDGGMAVFDCRICDDTNKIIASAQLTLYQPGEEADGNPVGSVVG